MSGNKNPPIATRRESDAWVRAAGDLVAAIPLPLFICERDGDRDLRIVAGNPAVENLFAVDLDEHTGRSIDLLLPAARGGGVVDEFLSVLDTGEPYRTESLYYRDERVEGAFRIRAFPLPEERLGVAVEDMTARVRVEDDLRREKEFASAIVRNSPDGVMVVSALGVARFVSPSMERILGAAVEPETRMDVVLSGLFPDQADRDALHRLWREDVDAGGGERTVRVPRPDGDRWCRFHSVVMPGGDVLVTCQDVTELKRTEEELRRSNEELDQFAHAVSHDLREPARVIRGFVDLLLERIGGDLPERDAEYFRHVVDGAERMESLIAALLDFARVGAAVRSVECVDANRAFERAVEALRLAVEESGADVSAGPLPVVRADAVQLERVFQNLLDNAVRFRGEVSPVVRVSAETVGGECVFSVRDNGSGVPPERADSVFEPFRRLAPERADGTGMGLAFCRRVIERAGGWIRVEPAPGGGSVFRFALPAAEDPEA